MNEFLKQDIFFFVTTIAVVLFTILGAILAIYVIRVMKNIDHIASRAKEQTDLLTDDLNSLRDKVRDQGFRIMHFWDFFKNINKKGKK